MDASKWKCKHCLCLHPGDFAGCGKCLKTRQECEEPLVPWTCRICRTIQPADFKGCGKCLKTRQECEESGSILTLGVAAADQQQRMHDAAAANAAAAASAAASAAAEWKAPAPATSQAYGAGQAASQAYADPLSVPGSAEGTFAYCGVSGDGAGRVGGWKEGDSVSVPGFAEGTFTFGGVSSDQVFYVDTRTGESVWALSLFSNPSQYMSSQPFPSPTTAMPSYSPAMSAYSPATAMSAYSQAPANYALMPPPAFPPGGALMPPPAYPPPMQGMLWTDMTANSANVAPSAAKKTNAYRPREGDWLCPKCNRISYATRDSCFRCKTKRPDDLVLHVTNANGPGAPGGSPPGSPPSSPPLEPVDEVTAGSLAGPLPNGQPRRNCRFWTTYGNCSRGAACSFLHEAAARGGVHNHPAFNALTDDGPTAKKRRTDDGSFAPGCSPPPPGLGDDGGGVENQEVMGGDWVCHKCLRVSLAHRPNCFRCNAPRPKKKTLG